MNAPPPELLPSCEAPSYSPPGIRGLEIGGGTHPRRLSYTQLDAIDWSNQTGLVYELADAHVLPYENGSFDHVFSSNLLEHFPADETTAVLTEWARVLKPGGLLELVVPDFMGVLRDYFAGVDTWPQTSERILGTRDYKGNDHRNAFCLGEFPDIIAAVPTLEFGWCRSSHAGGGVHSLSVRIPGA